MESYCKILIVEDEFLLRQGIKNLVHWEQEGFQVVGETNNGKEALQLIESLHPHLVITDIVMPIMDGIELTGIIQERYPEIKVVVLSSYSDFEYIKSAMKNGAEDYLLKPTMNPDSLLKAVQSAAAKLNLAAFQKQQTIPEQMVQKWISGFAADVLEALGANITVEPEKSKELLDKVGFCFLFAQKYHPAMRFVGAVRKEMGIRTMFNVLGPLSNPARANMQLMGVYDEKLVEPLAHVLKNLGLKKLMVVYGMDCLDEISLSAPTKVCEYRDGEFKSYEITPEQFGFTRCKKEDLVGGEPAANAQIAREILDGVKGPKMDAVLLNAGAAIYIATDGITIEQGIEKAREMITGGKAKAKLEQLIEDSNK